MNDQCHVVYGVYVVYVVYGVYGVCGVYGVRSLSVKDFICQCATL